MTEEIMCCQRLLSKNTTNGKPRRLWVVYNDEGDIIEIHDEGYAGKPRYLKEYPELREVVISVREYKSFVEYGKYRRIYKEYI